MRCGSPPCPSEPIKEDGDSVMAETQFHHSGIGFHTLQVEVTSDPLKEEKVRHVHVFEDRRVKVRGTDVDEMELRQPNPGFIGA